MLRPVVYGLARTPSLAALALVFAVATYVIVAALPFVLLLPFVVLALVVPAVMVWDTFRSRAVLEEALSQPLSTAGLEVPRMREHVQRAIEYREQLRDVLLARDPDSADLATIEDSAVLVERLCRTIDQYERDRLLARDTERVERTKLRTEAEQEQLRTLRELKQQMQQAERQAIQLLATLGETYASIRHLESIPETEGKAPEVLGRLRSRSRQLQDTVQALEELYQGSLAPSPKGA